MAFYDDMADVATELLTEFGKTITLERISKTFNKITGKDSARTTATSTTVGVEIPINQRLVDGTRIQAGDRFFVIDSSYTPAVGDRLQDSPFVPCVYPMDATLAEIQAISPLIDALPVMTDAYQTGTLTIQGGLSSDWETVAAPAFALPGPNTVTFSSGKKVFEWDYAWPDLTGAASDGALGWMFLVVFYNNNFDNGIVHLYLRSSVTAGVQLTELKVFRLGIDVSGFIPVTRTGRLAVVMDASTGTFSVESSAGVALLSSNTYTTATPCILSINLNEANGLAAEFAGLTMSASLITRASEMSYTAPASGTDIDGNYIGYPEVSPSWSIIDIQPIKPADTVIAYRLQVRK